jgi:hypothetical protein
VKPTSELTLAYDYNQLCLRDAAHELSADETTTSTLWTRQPE